MARADTIKERPASGTEWGIFLAAIASRALAHTRAMITSDPRVLGAWTVEVKSERARLSPDSVLIKLNMRHGCGARLTLAKLIDRRPPLSADMAEVVANNMVADAIHKAGGHSRHCDAREALMVDSLPSQFIPTTPPSVQRAIDNLACKVPMEKLKRKRKRVVKACVLCGKPDDQFPAWDDDCNHTPTERKGK